MYDFLDENKYFLAKVNKNFNKSMNKNTKCDHYKTGWKNGNDFREKKIFRNISKCLPQIPPPPKKKYVLKNP